MAVGQFEFPSLDNCDDGLVNKINTQAIPPYSACHNINQIETYTDFKTVKEKLCSAATRLGSVKYTCCIGFFFPETDSEVAYGYPQCYENLDGLSELFLGQALAADEVNCDTSTITQTDTTAQDKNTFYAGVKCPIADSTTDAPTDPPTDAPDTTIPTQAPPPPPSPSPNNNDGEGFSAGEVVAISFGAVFGIVLAGGAIAAG